MRLCIRGCGQVATRPVRKDCPSRSYCQAHWQALPCNQRAQWASQNPKRKAQAARNRARRIRIGDRYVGSVETAEQAQQIRAYIKQRTYAFIAGQRQRAEAEAD
jgi:hypothetical protein